MRKPNRNPNTPSGKTAGNEPRKRRAAVCILAAAACFSVVLASCGNGGKLSLSWMDNLHATGSLESSEAVSSSVPASSAPSSAAPVSSAEVSSTPVSSAPEVAHVDYAEAKKPLWISVSLSDQNVSVFDADDRLVYQFACSTGKPGDDTPTGTFSISDKGKSFYNPDVQQGAYYWTRFKGTYLFHSLPFDSKQKMIQAEADKLGSPASHGCVRLTVENAKWIYDNIPKGTKVVIQ